MKKKKHSHIQNTSKLKHFILFATVYEISFSDICKKLFAFFKDLKKLCPLEKFFRTSARNIFRKI